MAKLSILKEIWEFIKHRKRYWLLPIIIILVLVGLLLVLTEGSAIAPFIYTLF
jgi:competence protein ComGC